MKKLRIKKESTLEAKLRLYLRIAKLPDPVSEFYFHPTRNWRFDFAYPERFVAIECEGGVWTGGRHTRGAGFIADCEKYNEALMLDWKVLRITDADITSGRAVRWIQQLLNTADYAKKAEGTL